MKQKLCSILLALTMVLTLLPVSALADVGAAAGESTPTEAPAASNVAKIGDTEYTTLQDAINAAGDAGSETTITLLTNVDLTNATIKQLKFTKANSNIVLDLAGNTVTAADGEAIMLNEANITLTIKNGTITNNIPGSYSDGLYAYAKCNNLSLTLDNVTINSRTQGLAVQGLTSNSNVTVKNSVITSTEELGIYYPPKSGTLSIENSQITGVTGIVVKGSTLNVSGDKTVITGFGPKIDPKEYYTGATDGSSTLTETGDAIYVESGYNDRDISVNISGGQLVSTNAKSIQMFIKNSEVTSVKRDVSVSGGTFSDLSALNYLAPSANVSVKLTADTQKDVVIPANTTVTLDLNGHNLTNVSGHTITNNGNLTVTGKGTVQNNADDKQTVYNNPGAEATLNGGHYEKPNTHGYVILNHGKMTANSGVSMSIWSDTHSSLFENGWYDTKANATKNNPSLTINGGTYDGGLNTIKNDDDAVLTINGGTFTNYTQAAFQNHGTAAVNGGTFTANSQYSIDNCGCDATHDPGKLTITNGTFTGTLYVRSQFSDVSISGGTFTGDITKTGGSLSLTGGTYTSDPTAYVADGAIARKDGDAQYTVVAKSNLTSGVYTTSPEGALAAGYIYYQNGDDTYTVYYPVPVIPNNNNNSSSTTTKNPDGSTTTTTTDKATGAVTETTTTANGSVGTVKTGANGSTEISASISAADVKAAEQKNAPVIAPITVTPAASSAAAPVIKLSVPANAGEVAVAIPVVNAKQGTVAVRVNPDGTEEIIKTAVVTENGLVLGVKGSMQIKVINNSKNFADTVGHWAASDVDFVSARELFNGTAPALFSPEANMTRGMVVTVIARLAGENTDGGANWYDKGCAWAVANGVSDGTDPNGSITREQLAAMLYRYCGSPAASGSLSAYADAASVSAFASDAMQWCVNNGIINGMDGLLNPQGQATRAQVSAMFARYIRMAAAK